MPPAETSKVCSTRCSCLRLGRAPFPKGFPLPPLAAPFPKVFFSSGGTVPRGDLFFLLTAPFPQVFFSSDVPAPPSLTPKGDVVPFWRPRSPRGFLILHPAAPLRKNCFSPLAAPSPKGFFLWLPRSPRGYVCSFWRPRSPGGFFPPLTAPFPKGVFASLLTAPFH